MYLFAHNCSHIQSSGDKNSPSGRKEVSISLVHHNYPSPEEHSAKGTIQGEKIGKLLQFAEVLHRLNKPSRSGELESL